MQKKRLPIGISSFAKIREGNYYYVDKTPLIIDLLNASEVVFLSRPRRFGKSLTIDTIAQLFSGNKELFTGLYAEENWDWEKTYPVIRISLAGESKKNNPELIERYITNLVLENARALDIALDDNDKQSGLGYMFRALVLKTQEKYGKRVVVLIDEYDKPILDNIDNDPIALEVRGILKSLYSQLKDLDSSIRFTMLTGVSKFGQMSLFSGLNHIRDITINKEYSALCGYTQKELEQEFAPELGEAVNVQEVRRWYNGYNWKGESVYNPFDILMFFDNHCSYQSYWIQTGGNTAFLYNTLQKEDFALSQISQQVDSNYLLSSLDVGKLSPIALLFQTGYLTIKDTFLASDGENYFLKFPNTEVRLAFNSGLWDCYLQKDSKAERVQIQKVLQAGDIARLQTVITSAFAGLPHDWYRNNDVAKYEGHWASAFYMFFASCCRSVHAEDSSSQGRADLVVEEGGNVFVFEFKMARYGDAQSALEQIKSKHYTDKYRAGAKQVFEIGVSFDPNSKTAAFAYDN